MFERFYHSFWQHPLLLWLFPALFLMVLPRRGGPFYGYLWLFTAETLLDPLCTGPVVDWLELKQGQATAVMVVFVLLGDFRYFWLLERFSGQERSPHRALLLASGWTLVVPVFTAVLIGAFPLTFSNPRHVFLAYECAFVALALVVRVWLVPRRAASPERRNWLGQVTSYVLLYYVLWAVADMLILRGLDMGFALRIVPNVLYYGLFLPFVFWKAPEDLKAS